MTYNTSITTDPQIVRLTVVAEAMTKWGLRRSLNRLFSRLHATIAPTKDVSERII
jgi:hypothetical protein